MSTAPGGTPALIEAVRHEAGHACCAAALGRRWGARVWGGGDAGAAGPDDGLTSAPVAAHYNRPSLTRAYTERDAGDLLTLAVCVAAGQVCVDLFEPGGYRHGLTAITGGDSTMLDSMAAALLGDGATLYEVRAFRELAAARAARILSRRWPGVGRVADALLARRHLPAADVAALFRETDEEQAARERWQVVL